MDCRRGPQTHATSVTTQEGNKMGVWGLSFWLWVAHSPTCFAQGLGSEFWKHGTFNDLQQFVFNKLRQTTSSVPICPLLSHSPGFYLCSAFEPGLKAVALKLTWPWGSPTPDKIPSNSVISFLQKGRVATGTREHCQCYIFSLLSGFEILILFAGFSIFSSQVHNGAHKVDSDR